MAWKSAKQERYYKKNRELVNQKRRTVRKNEIACKKERREIVKLAQTGDWGQLDVALETLQTEPFREVLGMSLTAMPSQEAWKTFADKSPDRWAQAVTMLARLAGYKEKIELDGKIAHVVHNLCDSDLLKKDQELEAELNKMEEAEYTVVDNE